MAPRFIGGVVGIATIPFLNAQNRGGASGVWDLIQQNYFKKRNVWPGTGYISVSGGNVADGLAPGNGYLYHTFTASGTLVIGGGTKTIEILVIGAGGHGGSGYYGGGGGAGGLIYRSNASAIEGTHSISIGAQGPGSGGDSSLNMGAGSNYVSRGGGYGGPRTGAGGPGGSGGGVGMPTPRGLGIQTTDPTLPNESKLYGFGNPGGPNAYGAGGGGSSVAGEPGPEGGGGDGKQFPQFQGPLIGLPAINPLNGFFAGGGAGGIYPSSSNPGGSGGGGNAPAGNASGYGSGGAGATPSGGAGGNATGGIVIIRYAF